jgi:hypothetical protein
MRRAGHDHLRTLAAGLPLAACLAACGGGTSLAADAGPTDGDTTPADRADDAAPADDGPAPDDGAETAGCAADEDCDDGLRCTGFERCVAGECRAGPLPDCADELDCTEDRCAEEPPYCVAVPRDDWCPPGWTCTLDGCAGECLADDDCDDRDPCTGTETCRDARCLPGTPLDCRDDVDCTTDDCLDGACRSSPDHRRCATGELCDPARGCVAAPSCSSADDCDDGDLCNGRETCVAGFCIPGTFVDCDDHDGCNGREACVAGACVPGTPLDCDDGDHCNGRETCVAGACVPGTAVDCDDGAFCNGPEPCLYGACRDGSPPCRDGLDCNEDLCDEAADRCSHVPLDHDGDGFGDAACGGDDCDDDRDWAHPGAPESCAGGVDEDCDGRTDCLDEACRALPECCTAARETCDGLDQDCDTTPDDGLTCFYLDDTVIRPYEGPLCALDFYRYDDPRPDSASLVPDLARPDTLVLLAHLGAGPCAGRASVIAVADAADGSGGTARLEWTSDPIEVSPIVVADDPDDCRHNDRLDAGRCDWDWTPDTTDGAALGNYPGDFCLFLRVRTPAGLTAIRVLDAAGTDLARDFESVFAICRRTMPNVP